MSHRLSLDKTRGWSLFLALLVTPAVAHNIEVSEDVAGTWHLEPNHNPKAGEPARAWVALTRKGGQILPLEQANCQLAVYTQPRKPGDSPVLQPTLKAMSVERYQGIPGADIIFPQTGIYQLDLSCTPKAEGNFQPFQMKYEVTVAEGVAAPVPKAETSPLPEELAQSQQTPATSAPDQQPSQSNQSMSVWILLAIATTTILGLGILMRRYTMKR